MLLHRCLGAHLPARWKDSRVQRRAPESSALLLRGLSSRSSLPRLALSILHKNAASQRKDAQLRRVASDEHRREVFLAAAPRHAVEPGLGGSIQHARLVELKPQAPRHAADEGEPRKFLQQRRGQEPIGRGQTRHPIAQPHAEYADALHHLAQELAVARRAGMPPRGNELMVPRQGLGGPAVKLPLAIRIPSGEQPETMFLDKWVQAPHCTVPIQRRQQPVQRHEPIEAQPSVSRVRHLVNQIRIDPVEDRQIKEQGAVPVREAAQQARVEEVSGERLAPLDALGRADRLHGPVDANGYRPPGRTLDGFCQLRPRQTTPEELADPVAPTNPMAPMTSGFTLSGTVRTSRPNGPALAGATVRLDTGQSTAAGSDGLYRFQSVSGAVTVTASGPHHVAASKTATMDQDRTVDFALDHTGIPPFEGTVFISPRLIDSSDSSSLMNVTYAGRGMREVFDRRVDRWISVDAYLFNVRYGWGAVEFQVNPEFGSPDAARAEVDTYAPALGRLPAFLMTNAREVQINAGVELFGGNANGSFLIHTGQGQRYIDDGFLEEILFHEAAHVSLDARHWNAPGWTTAQNADGVFVSTYARDNPGREDMAESILPYFAVRRRSARLGDADQTAILAAIPNRLEYFDRQGFVN